MSGHECFRCPRCGSCPACAADALDRVIEEAECYRERLGQYEAYDITVASALDSRARCERLEIERDEFARAEDRERTRAECALVEVARLEAALRPFVDPASYSTTEEECRLNPAMDWCAVHSFRWPCPVDIARAALAGQEVGR